MYVLPHELDLGGAKQKYLQNLAAIRLLKTLQKEERPPADVTDEERSVLAHYTGWGDTEVRKLGVDWSGKAKGELAELVGALDLEALNKSVLNAHYTDLQIVRAIWGGLEQLGIGALSNPWILEPAVGIGHFIGAAPPHIRAKAQIVAVELDRLTADICGYLYPEAVLHRCGFEAANLPMGRFDVVVSNVPFGEYGVSDPTLKPKMLTNRIHDYFLARSLTYLRSGGILAVITSRYTMDKQQTHIREWISQHAELVGAYRLPHTAFERNAGTSVVTDVLFFRRKPREETPANVDWIKTLVQVKEVVGKYTYSDATYTEQFTFDANAYFIANPRNVLGEMTRGSHGLYGRYEMTVKPSPDLDTAVALRAAIRSTLPANLLVPGDTPEERETALTMRMPGDPHFPDGTPVQKALEGIYRSAKAVLQAQVEGAGDEVVAGYQEELNRLYDAFRAAHGPITIRLGKKAKARPPVEEVKGTPIYPFLLSLEDRDGERQAIFTTRTVRPAEKIVQVESAKDALYICLDKLGKVNLRWIAEAVGRSIIEVREELRGLIFKTPEGVWETADEYLSGNIRAKLKQAEALADLDDYFTENVKALKDALPPPLGPEEITARMGAGWIPESVVVDFLEVLFPSIKSTAHYHGKVRVKYVDTTAEWYVEGFSPDTIRSIENVRTWGAPRRTGIELVQDALNSKIPVIYDTEYYTDGDGKKKERQVRNDEQTMVAQGKLQDIKAKWNSWIWINKARAEQLCKIYNDTYNGFRVCKFDGGHLTFPGMSNVVTLRGHQLQGVARTLKASQDNPAYIHEVGAGKTFTGVAAGVKAVQLGLTTKALYIVPKHLVGQWRDAFTLLYPGLTDQLLVAEDDSFTPVNRGRFISLIATGGYRFIVLTYEQFKSIPLSLDTFEAALNKELAELREHMIDLKEDSANREANRRVEREFKKREAALERFRVKFKEKHGEVRRDSRETITFEQLGVGMLFFDESQALKNDWIHTKMTNVAGMPKAESQRAFDARIKIHHTLDCKGKVIFLTGTPVTNTLAEAFVVMRFLQPSLLHELGIQHFDGWAGVFADPYASIEMDAVGKFRTQTRLRFTNLPELMALLGQSWDRAKVDVEKPRMKGGQMTVIKVEGSPELRSYTLALAERANDIRSRKVKPDEDNMLLVTSDGRKASLFNGPPSLCFAKDRRTKVDALVEKVTEIHRLYEADRGTQLVFCDLFTPKARGEIAKETEAGAEDEGAELVSLEEAFAAEGVYGEIRRRLVAAGIPDAEIAYIHEAKTDKGKDSLFRKVRKGEIRVLIGSTSKMGTGMNVQDRCIALHNLDCPWRPADLEQRNGRILRQGNMYKEVFVFAYVTEGSYDPVNWQYIETKARFIAQVMAGEVATRTADDVGDMIVTASLAKAIALGDSRILDKIRYECDLLSLSRQYKAWVNGMVRMKWLIESLPRSIESHKTYISQFKMAIETRDRYADQEFVITLWSPHDGKMVTFRKREDANKHLALVAKNVKALARKTKDDVVKAAGSYRGFNLEWHVWNDVNLHIIHRGGARFRANVSEEGTTKSIDYQLRTIEAAIAHEEAQIDHSRKELESLEEAVKATWPHVERARTMLTGYRALCADLATGGLVEQQEFDFGVLARPEPEEPAVAAA